MLIDTQHNAFELSSYKSHWNAFHYYVYSPNISLVDPPPPPISFFVILVCAINRSLPDYHLNSRKMPVAANRKSIKTKIPYQLYWIHREHYKVSSKLVQLSRSYRHTDIASLLLGHQNQITSSQENNFMCT